MVTFDTQCLPHVHSSAFLFFWKKCYPLNVKLKSYSKRWIYNKKEENKDSEYIENMVKKKLKKQMTTSFRHDAVKSYVKEKVSASKKI